MLCGALLAGFPVRAHEWHAESGGPVAHAGGRIAAAPVFHWSEIAAVGGSGGRPRVGSKAVGTTSGAVVDPGGAPRLMGAGDPPEGASLMARTFLRFQPSVRFWWDGAAFHVASDGVPAHGMMEGITAWQRQIPVPTYYFGTNAWVLPLRPVPAAVPQAITTNRFLQGAIALAANGIPIFNPANNRGEISALIGELDRWGGHCGRADDYHYHAAPLHLTNVVGIELPIAFAMDGYPIYGLLEPDGSEPVGLDAFRGHVGSLGTYHYHASLNPPYVNGGFHGEVVALVSTNGQGEVVSQAGWQPRVNPVRPSGTALGGAVIRGFTNPAPDRFEMSYSLPASAPATNAWKYTLNRTSGVVSVTYQDSAGVRTTNYPNWRPRPGWVSSAEPLVTVAPEGRSGVPGGGLVLEAAAMGEAPLAYQWLHNGSALAEDARFSGVRTPVLSIRGLELADAGEYSLLVTNRLGATLSRSAIVAVEGGRSVTRGLAQTIVTNLLPGGQRVSAVGRLVGDDGVTWTVPAATQFGSGPVASDLYNDVSGVRPAGYAEVDLSRVPVVEVDPDGEVITGHLFADNYFELYVNGVLVAYDPVPFTPFNSCIVRFRAKRPITYAVRLVDWEENLGVGTELNGGNPDHAGDGGFMASFSDGTVTGRHWRAQTFYVAPLADPAQLVERADGTRDSSAAATAGLPAASAWAVHWPVPAGWMTRGFDDSAWPVAREYTEADIGVDNKPAYLRFPAQFGSSGARFIWSSNLVLDNEVLVRFTGPGPASNTAPAFLPAPALYVVNAGENVVSDRPAADPDAGGSALTFRLEAAPAGASVGATTGRVTWTPTAGQAGSSNLFRVVVTDAGSPPLSATNQFAVIVRTRQPNVVVIVTDDHGYGDLGAHGGIAATPNMDRLGREGIRLERFYATAVCSVTRSTFLTGRNPIRTGVNNSRGLSLQEHLLPQSFRAAGYQTYMCGKWHLGGLYNTETNTVVLGVSRPVIREGVEYQPQMRGWDVHYGEYTGAIGYQTHVSGETDQPDWWLNGVPNADAGWSTDLLADKAVSLLKQRDPTKPVLVYLAFNAVHGPVSAPAEYLNKYQSVADVRRRTLAAAMDHMDVAIGRVLAAIDSEGISTNTLVAFFGDNGGQQSTGGSNLPLRGDKGDLFDGGIHTPAAVRWPGVLPSGVTNYQGFAWVGDWFPTLCAATGVAPLNERPFDGVNLWPLWLAATNGPFTPGVWRGVPLMTGSSAGSAVLDLAPDNGRQTVFKLVHDRLGGGGGGGGGGGFTNLLFDIVADPLEVTNRVGEPALSGLVTRLAALHDTMSVEAYTPYVGVHPEGQKVQAGTNVTLWAMTTAYNRGVRVAWRRNGVVIPGATNLTVVDASVYLTQLRLTNVQPADGGIYDVAVTGETTGWPTTATSRGAVVQVEGGGVQTNTAPRLAFPAELRVRAGQTLAFTNQAVDAEAPPQSIRYLLAEAPSGAVLDAVSGLLTWSPGVVDVGRTNRFVIVALDDGIPPLAGGGVLLVVVDPEPVVGDDGYDVLVGRPTDRTVALSILARRDAGILVDVGTTPGSYDRTTPWQVATNGRPLVIALDGLEPDRRYHYRVRSGGVNGSGMKAGPERSFQTARARGSTFRFAIEADPHHRDNEPEVWRLALTNMLADGPDFLIDLGDTFMEEKVGITNTYYLTEPGIRELHREVREGFFGLVGHSLPTFLVNGNHEAELGWLLRILQVTNNPAVWSARARQEFFPVPIPSAEGFYRGATAVDPSLNGPRDGYYAFEWGDALFVALDPFWYTNPKPAQGAWGWTLGAEQHAWLKRTLEGSSARYKFVFLHHLVGGGQGNQSRGGLTHAPFYEWGGRNADGTPGFATMRPGWSGPIESLLLSNHVQAVFHGHDHLYVKEDLDVDGDGKPELVYQEVPQPSRTLFGTNSAVGYGYTNRNSTLLGNSGHLRVTVSPSNAVVEYVRVYLPANEGQGRTNRMVSHRYEIPPWTAAVPSRSVPVPDTGQTNRYGVTEPGTDADYLIQPPTYVDRGDGTVEDRVTGLLWQRVDGGEMTWTNALRYAATNRLGGVAAGEWRLPTLREAMGLLVHYRQNPALDPTYFSTGGGVAADYWWTSDTWAADPSRVWVINAGGGAGAKVQTETLSAGGTLRYHARLVRGPRGGAATLEERFVDHGDGTVTDRETGLTWQQGEATATMGWLEALRTAEGLTLGGYRDWRLPNVKELQSLGDVRISGPWLPTARFPGVKSDRYWSSTTQNNRTTNAWWVEFGAGTVSQAPKTSAYWVRAVRGGLSNTPPTIAAVPDVSGSPGQVLRVPLKAEDRETDFPLLRFRMESGPAGSSLDPITGVFAWRVPVTLAGFQGTVDVAVEDAGDPALTGRSSFRLIGQPLAMAPSVAVVAGESGVGLRIEGVPGPDYVIEGSTNLTLWAPVFRTNAPALPLLWRDTSMELPWRFYRVRAE